jgi:uncharacterized protein (TIGR02594 family)
MKDLLIEMLRYYGLKEVFGPESNPIILKMFKEIGYDWVEDDSETAWCSAALNYFCKQLGYERSGKLDARSWMGVGTPTDTPEIGDVVVLWRVNISSWEGHVGLYISESEDFVYICGGNQNNMLSIAPYKKSRVLGYRKLNRL